MIVIVPPVSSDHLNDRAGQAFRKRKRYLRRLTGITGQGWPLTRITSPYRPLLSLLSKRTDPSALKEMSANMSGTSNSPCGMGNPSSWSSWSR